MDKIVLYKCKYSYIDYQIKHSDYSAQIKHSTNENLRISRFNRYINQQIKRLTSYNISVSLIDSDKHNNIIKTKILVYYSSEIQDNLNGIIMTHGNPSPYIIVCRHLSIGYLQNSFYFSEIDTANKLSNHHCFKTDIYDTYCTKLAKQAYYFTLLHLPYVLKTIADNITDLNIDNAFLFNSTNHLMGIKIRKSDNLFVIYLYDPNDTLRDKRIILHQTKDILRLNLSCFFNKQDIDLYFPEKTPSACLLSIQTTTKYCKTMIIGEFNPTIGYLMLFWGHFKAPIDNISNNLDLFFTNSIGVHGLLLALCYCRYDAVKKYVFILDKSNLSDFKKYKQLDLYFNYMPILLFLIQIKKFDMIIAHISYILTTHLPDIYKYMLLLSEDINKNNTAYHTIKTGNTVLVEKYTKLILQSKLPVDYIIKLLYFNVDSRLKYELSFNSKIHHAINAYINIIDTAKLNTNYKNRLTYSIKNILHYTDYQYSEASNNVNYTSTDV